MEEQTYQNLYEGENYCGEQFGIDWENFGNNWQNHQERGYESWAYRPEPTTMASSDIPNVVMNQPNVESLDFAPQNPICVTSSQNFVNPLISNSRPDHMTELSVTMPREMGHNFEYEYEGTSGTTYDFQGYQGENQFGG